MIPNIAVILTDSEKRIIWVNDDFVSITGYSLNEVLGKKPSAVLQGEASERAAILRIRKALEDKVSIKDQITNYRKNGEAYLCKLVIHPVFDEDQNLVNFIAFEVDGDEIQDDEDFPLLNLNDKYKSSSLKGIDEIKLFLKLKYSLEKEKLYLDPNLTLKMVADKLATNTKYLSQVVNRHANKNFQTFINTYRVKEAKDKITDTSFNNLTLYGIALQCGFKNKSTFYKVFKEMTHTTPKEFLKTHNHNPL